jgi:hypothetical protein
MHQRPQVPNMAAVEAALAVVLQQAMVALVYLVQVGAVVERREATAALMAEHGVTMAPLPVYMEVLEGQGQLLEPQGRAEAMVAEMVEVVAVLELEEVLVVLVVQAVLQAVAVVEERVEVMEEVLTQE